MLVEDRVVLPVATVHETFSLVRVEESAVWWTKWRCLRA